MAFLTLNGWTIPVLNETASELPVYWGKQEPAWTNRPNPSRRNIPREWQIEAKFQDENFADSLEGLIEGAGHHFSFNHDAFSDDGIGPDAGATYSLNSDFKIYGQSSLDVGTSITWDVKLPRKWTVMYWRDVQGSPEHIVRRSDGGKWINGVRNDSTNTSELTVDPTFYSVSLTTGAYDDLVILPYVANYLFIEQFYAAGVPFSSLPYINMSGDIIDNKEVEVLGQVEGENYKQHATRSGWRNNARPVQALLQEKKGRERKRLPRTLATFKMDANYRDGVLIRPAYGPFADGTVFGAVPTGDPGPFGLGESWEFESGEYMTIPGEVVASLDGLGAASFLAWVRISNFGLSTVFDFRFNVGGGGTKAGMNINGDTTCTFYARNRDSDSLASVTSVFGSPPTTTNRFYLYCGIVDFPNNIILAGINGGGFSTATTAFSGDFFRDGGHATQYVARDQFSGQLRGSMSALYIIPRRITESEFKNIYELGKQGVFL